MNKNLAILNFALAICLSANAQEFLTPTNTFSHEKTAYVTLVDGTELEGTLDDVDRKKGMIESITIVNSSGEKRELQAESVEHMYLPPSGFDELQKAGNLASDVQKWNDEKLNQDLFGNGYAYFELGEVMVKKEKHKLLMQLLNPSFSKTIKVYYDPLEKSTGSFSYGGLTLAGGTAKSYYVRKTDGEMVRLEKKNYEEEFGSLYEKCPSLVEKYPDGKWRDLAQHVIAYSACLE